MKLPMHFTAASVAAVALLLTPMTLGPLPVWTGTAAYAGNGNGNGGGNDEDHGGGNGNSSDRGSDHSNGGGNGKGSERSDSKSGGSERESKGKGQDEANGGRKSGGLLDRLFSGKDKTSDAPQASGKSAGQTPKKKEQAPIALAPQVAPEPAVRRNMHAQLGGLNSLQRNVNGLMNSSDPKMEGIRQFVIDSANAEAATAAFEEAAAVYDAAIADYEAMVDSLSLTYEDQSLQGLQARLDELHAAPLPEDPTWVDEVETLSLAIETISTSSELAALEQAQADLDAAKVGADAAAAASGDEALVAALVAGANDNRVGELGADYVTPEMLDWAKSVLGVGDYVGTIDDYIAMQESAGDESTTAEAEATAVPAP